MGVNACSTIFTIGSSGMYVSRIGPTRRLGVTESQSILMAHPKPAAFSAVTDALAMGHTVIEAADAWTALAVAKAETLDAAVIHAGLPGLNLLDFLRRFGNATTDPRPLTVLICPNRDIRGQAAVTHGLADGFIDLPCPSTTVLTRLWHIMDDRAEKEWSRLNHVQYSLLHLSKQNLDMLDRAVRLGEPIDVELVDEVTRSLVEAAVSKDLLGVLDALERHHKHTFVHSLKVSSRMTLFGQELGMGVDDLTLLAQAGLIHDIGKTSIPDDILNKPGPLDAEEWALMRTHALGSSDLLECVSSLPLQVRHVAQNHHEHLDGSGYPRGLSSGQIDDLSLVCGVIDAFSALTEKRAYKVKRSSEEAFAIMNDRRGTQFEPHYLNKFEEMVRSSVIR